jgi:predicted metal-dependent phosphoesterase TrpH
MIDLHTHSTASDGSLSPAALIALASERGLSAIALTDHDTIAGLDEAEAAARDKGIRFIRGVEIEIDFKPGEFHLLGLGFAGAPEELADKLRGFAQSRLERNRKIIDSMRADGMAVEWDELIAHSGASMVGRPHIAAYLVQKKIVKTRQLAFDRFIGKGRPYYFPKACVPLEEGIGLIQRCGGLAVIAHPMSLFVSWTRLRALFPEWSKLGVDGVEAWHPTARRGECEKLEALAIENGFLSTAGSDYHGEPRPERKLGITAGDRKIEDRFLDGIDNALAARAPRIFPASAAS